MKKFLAESAAVCAGGALGAAARCAVADWLAPHFVAAVFACNVLGCFAFALYADFERRPPPKLGKFHLVGLCGGLTTFSTFSLQVAALAAGGWVFGACALFLGTFASCMAAAYLSGILADFAAGRRTAWARRHI